MLSYTRNTQQTPVRFELITLPCDPAIPLLGIYTENKQTNKQKPIDLKRYINPDVQ